MVDRYAVFGNPIGHSRSPEIHALFAAQTAQDITYEAVLAPQDGFSGEVARQVSAGLRGANVTVPFKEEAFRLADRLTDRAVRAGAVNTLSIRPDGMLGDNTDGAGLLLDLAGQLGTLLTGQRILLLGAGGAARGVLAPLLEQHPHSVFVANRTADKARLLVRQFADLGELAGGGLADLAGRQFDLVVNATSASLEGDLPPLPAGLFARDAFAYDMMYRAGDTPFLAFARSQGVRRCADGLGMLVEQAAEAFFVWRGIRPDSRPVLIEMRRRLSR